MPICTAYKNYCVSIDHYELPEILITDHESQFAKAFEFFLSYELNYLVIDTFIIGKS
jgi:hypothetical protein